MSEKKFHVAIIGGGITGLSAAFSLHQQMKKKNLPLTFTLIESSERLGGKIQTQTQDGFVIERGPDSFLARKRSAAELVKEVGLESELVHNEAGQSYVLHRNQLMPIPEGAVMGIPTKLTPFVSSSLFSPIGKMRAALDLVLPRANNAEDESVGHFFRRRLGNEVVDHLIEPLLSGIYAGNLDRLSLLSTFPNFRQLERKNRSLILGIKKTRPPQNKPEKKPQGIFLTLKRGLQSLVEAIEAHLPTSSIIKQTALKGVEKTEDGYLLFLSSGRSIHADAVILTVPHQITRNVLARYSFIKPLDPAPPTTVATVALAYPEAVDLGMDGTGFLVPRQSDYTITACTWTHRKWPHTTPPGKSLLRCYVGRADEESIVDESDDVILETVQNDLKRSMNIDTTPSFTHITRWHKAMPQYIVGHNKRLESTREQLKQHLPGIILAGSSYEGVGIPDCIDQGKQAVDDVLEVLSEKAP